MRFKHNLDFIVDEAEVNADGRMTLHALANRMEQAATSHADLLGVSVERLVNNGIAWVLTRMLVKIERMPETYEHLILYTWPVSINRLQFRRDFELVDNTGMVIARATTQWVIIDLSARKVVKIPSYVNEAVLVNGEEALNEPKWRLPEQSKSPALYETRAVEDDIDINNHVNNVRYVKWVYEAMADEDRDKIKAFEILYRAEALLNDEIEARGKINDGKLGVSLFRKSDGAELVRTQITGF